MKKLFSVITCALLLTCTVLPFCSSADGMILWQDNFSEQIDDNWMWDGSAFEIENDKLEGYAEAVVHQSKYREEDNGNRKFNNCSLKVTAHGIEDGGKASDSHSLGFWFADYLSDDGTELGTTGQIVYKWTYNFEKTQMELEIEFANDAEAFAPSDWVSGVEPYRTYPVNPANAPQLDPSSSEEFTIGIRFNGSVISGYINDTKVMDFNSIRGAASFQQRPSPVLLLNGKCHCTFDDLIVATADYDLFNEGTIPTPNPDPNPNPNPTPNPTPNPNPNPTPAETKIETRVETETDAQGNTVTKIVSEVVTVPTADTNTGAHGTGGAQTGDMAVVVVAVMVVALGSAIAVKKFSREG